MKSIELSLLNVFTEQGYNAFLRGNEICWYDPKRRGSGESSGKISISSDGSCYGILPPTLILKLIGK